MLNLRLVVPAELSADVTRLLVQDERVTNVVLLPGAALDPPGDALSADVAREGASDVLGRLRRIGLDTCGGVTVTAVESAPSHNARRAERAAPGAPDDAVVWDIVEEQARSDSRPSWGYYAFLTLATMIASVAVVTDSSVLVVGAMVVGPEFAVVAALAVGLARRAPRLAGNAAVLLLYGFGAAIGLSILAALAARAAGWIDTGSLTAARPLTVYIWRPDHWSVVIALLAGVAGVLSVTSGRGNALVGVFISVTTVPAAGFIAVGAVLGNWSEVGGSALQLVINLVGIVVTLLVVGQFDRYRAGRRSGRDARG